MFGCFFGTVLLINVTTWAVSLLFPNMERNPLSSFEYASDAFRICKSVSLFFRFFPFTLSIWIFFALGYRLAEEPVFFGILPTLLSSAMGNTWKIAGAQLGSWWLAICVYFGLAHTIDLSSPYGFQFDGPGFVAITLFTLPHGWIATRCGSVWPCVIGHSLNNSIAVAIGLFLK